MTGGPFARRTGRFSFGYDWSMRTPHSPARPLAILTAALSGLAVGGAPAVAAQEAAGWNSARAVELMERARAVRQSVRGDSALTSYQADARGYVYFYLDRSDTGETALVKTDQVALEVYWKAPDSTKQRIVGLRDEKRLPTNIRYHLDHLTVVQDEFQNLIRLGDGDEVAAVVHPAAPASGTVYDFRVNDSITIAFQGDQEAVRVYEVEVRPKDFTRPGFVGSVFLDRRDGAIVRMTFTFTPASYVDDYLDYIRIALDNSLWDGRYWLPYQQQVEIRRELPYLDFVAGSVIRGRYDIRGYRFNEPLPPLLFLGGPVAAVPEAERRAFPFEEALYAELDQEGLRPLPELAEIRREAVRIAGRQYLSGLGRYRLWAPNASSVARANRAEGTVLGVGLAVRPREEARLQVGAGYGFGRERPVARTLLEWEGDRTRTAVSVEWNAMRDLGPVTAASGAFNTLAWTLADRDYLDPYFVSGGRVEVSRRAGPLRVGGTLLAEAVRSGSAEQGRAVRQVDRGTAVEAGITVRSASEASVQTSGSLWGGTMDGGAYGRAEASVGIRRAWLTRGTSAGASLRGGWTSESAPLHHRYLLGGRGTLPGYGFRGFGGDRYLLARVETSKTVREPWLGLGVFGAVGATWLRSESTPVEWDTSVTGLARYSAGFTASAFWDVLHLELGRGLNGGGWELQLYVSPRFWPWL